MTIKIKETGKIEELGIIDPESGTNWVSDLIGNHGGIGDNTDWHMVRAGDDDCCDYDYVTSQDNYDWWVKLIDAHEAVDYRLYQVKQQIDEDEWSMLEHEIGNISCDLEDYPATLNTLLDEYSY